MKKETKDIVISVFLVWVLLACMFTFVAVDWTSYTQVKILYCLLGSLGTLLSIVIIKKIEP